MTTRYLLPLILLSAALIAGCKPSRDSRIIGLWQEVYIQNPQMDDAIEAQKMFVDTVGRHGDSASNMLHYGIASIDTLKKSLQANIDSFTRAQSRAIRETWFDFHPDSLVYLHSDDGLDSAKWYFDDDGALMLDEERLKGGGNRIRMEVQALNDTALQLHFTEKYLNSTATFKRVKR